MSEQLFGGGFVVVVILKTPTSIQKPNKTSGHIIDVLVLRVHGIEKNLDDLGLEVDKK